MGEQVEHCHARRSRAKCEHHEPEVANGGVRQYPLEVRHGKRHNTGHEGRQEPDHGDQVKGVRDQFVDREQADDQVDTGNDHRRGVDERADRSRPFHCVRQPDVQRHLRGFARRAGEDQYHRPGEFCAVDQARAGEAFYRGDVKRSGGSEQEYEADKQRHVTDTGGSKRLLRRFGRRSPLPPEADEQVGSQPDQLPAKVEQQEVVCEDEGHHGGYEQRLDGEVPPQARLVTQVLK